MRKRSLKFRRFHKEIADPNTNDLASSGGRFVELYNNMVGIDLSGWGLRRWTNDNKSPQNKILDGVLNLKFFIIQ